MKTAFFIIESPMQLITAIEAKHYFTPEKSILFIRYNKEERNDNQIKKILKYSDFEDSYSIRIKEYSKFAYVKLLYVYTLLLFYHPDTLFIGDYKANFMKMIYRFFKKEKCIFLDDGAQSSYIYAMDKRANMFSYFKFNHDPSSKRLYVHNTFEYFKSVMKNNNKKILNDVVYFIGAPLVEKEMITSEQFDYYFSRVVCYYEKKGMTIKYLPHRHENNNKLDKYQNIEIIVLDEPVELYLLHANFIPVSISSFYSAALYTIQLLFKDIMHDNLSFYFPPEVMNVSKEIQDKIEEVYTTLEGIMDVNYSYLD